MERGRPALGVEEISGVRLRGEIDMSNAHELEAAVRRAAERGGPVVVDLDEVTFIDSTGIRALLQGANGTSGCVILHGDRANVTRVLDLVVIDHASNIHRIRHAAEVATQSS
jgi:anti-anti-sigma factor